MDDMTRMAAQVGENTARRFFAKIRIADSGCWEWTAARSGNGYGRFSVGDRASKMVWFSHRFAYTQLVSPIPEGLVLDHYVCENKGCCNPAHLRVATHRENLLRGNTPAARNLAKTHCPRGHKYTPENTRLNESGRTCRTCRRDDARELRARERAERSTSGAGNGPDHASDHH